MSKSGKSKAARHKDANAADDANAPLAAIYPDFALDKPLPKAVKARAFGSGGYPYAEKLGRKEYEADLQTLQIELAKLQSSVRASGARIVVVFEGRDAAGKGGMIARWTQHLNPRDAHVVALGKPTEREAGQWYFQRYISHLPAKGEIVLFDRSWYNRAGVERVMGFCTKDQHRHFLQECPIFERMLVREGIQLFKYWLTIGREEQMLRFHARASDPLKRWKLSPIDIASLDKWGDYAVARDDMLRATHTHECPWTVIRANDKKRARLNAIRHFLNALDYDGKDADAIGAPDPGIVLSGADA